jgi:hypothetical protein
MFHLSLTCYYMHETIRLWNLNFFSSLELDHGRSYITCSIKFWLDDLGGSQV